MKTPYIFLAARLKESAREFIQSELQREGVTDLDTCYGDIFAPLFESRQVQLTELAKLSRRSKSTVSFLVDKLEKKGYVRKAKDESDARVTWIFLTEKGLNLQSLFESISERVNKRLLTGFTDEEQKVFEQLLQKAVNNF